MRVADRPLPTFTPNEPTQMTWPVDVHLIIEQQSVLEQWDNPGVDWDDPRNLWDQASLPGTFSDVSCDMSGVEIEHGAPDELYLFPAGTMKATLIDSTGKYGRYNPDGTLTTWQVGKRIGVVGHDTQWWWLFFGRITAWSDFGDGTIEIEAFNVANELQEIGPFTAGANGDKPNTRLAAIEGKSAVTGTLNRFDPGTVTLTAQQSDKSPWEEMQIVALSDGGVLFGDTDDALVYLDRSWRKGRADQVTLRTFSDNVCSADVVVWDINLNTSDDDLATQVTLTNVAGLRSAVVQTPNRYSYASPLTHGDPDQWTTQAEGDALAQYILDTRGTVHAKIDEFTLYVHDARQDLWPIARDTRIGDRFLFFHEYQSPGSTNQFSLGAIVNSLRMSITPDEWLMSLGAWTYVLPVATTAQAGHPGRYLDATGQPAQVVQSFGQLATLTPAPVLWKNGEYIVTGDGTESYHDLTGWHVGRAPVPSADRWGSGRWQRSTWASPQWDEASWEYASWAPPSSGDKEFDSMIWDGGVWQ